LIIKKISKIGATRSQILRLKCTKIDFSAGTPPQTPLGELTTLPRPPICIKGPTSKGNEREGEEKREGEGRGGEEGPYTPPVANSWLRHWHDVQNRF